jgi:RND family efflux transporter MFP subunit
MSTSSEKVDLSSLRISSEKKDQSQDPGVPWKIVVPAVVAVLLVAGYFLLRPGMPGTTEVEMATATLTSPAQANAVLTASGYVVAQVKAAVASKGTGRLERLFVEEGDNVKKGDLIARLEDQDVIASLERARADLAVARADSTDARRSVDRQQSLLASGLSSKAEFDAAEARYGRVVATIHSALAAVRSAQVGLENTRIRAPFDGTVLTKNADVGEVVAPFASSANSRGAVVTMADMSSLQVEADVSESNITRVTPGQPCEIVLDAYPEKRYAGSVHKIVPTADRAKATVMTKVKFRERDSRVLPEMSAKVTFLSKDAATSEAGAPSRLTVPASAVVPRNGSWLALGVRDGKIVETPVRTGATLGNRIEILEGLVQGDQVVLHPDPSLTPGTNVKTK